MSFAQYIAGVRSGEIDPRMPSTFWRVGCDDYYVVHTAKEAAQRAADRTGRTVAVTTYTPGQRPVVLLECYPREQKLTFVLDPL